MQASQVSTRLTDTVELSQLESPAIPAPATHPLLDELRDVAKESLSALLSDALAGAGGHFTSKVESALGDSHRRHLLDVLQSLRPYVPRIQRNFAAELDRAFNTRVAPPGSNNLTLPRTAHSSDALWRELSAQLTQLSVKLNILGNSDGFAPARIYAALHSALLKAELPRRMMPALMALLDEDVMAYLDRVYRRVLERLKLHKLPNADTAGATAANQPRTAGSAGVATRLPTPFLQIDARTEALLHQLAQVRDLGKEYSNAQLASEILRGMSETQDETGEPTIGQALTQRLALVGELFQSVSSDEHLSQAFRDSFEQLRFAIIKSAISDDSFFGHRVHPLRLLATELTQLAANAFLSGGAAERQLQLRLEGVATLFDLSAAFVRPMLTALLPMPAPVIERFLSDLKDEARERELWRRSRAQLLAVKAIESRCFGNPIPAAMITFLNQHWTAVLARRLLAEGWDSEALSDGLACVDEAVDAVPASDPAQMNLTPALLRRLIAGLQEQGLSAEQVRATISMLTRRVDTETPLKSLSISAVAATKVTPAPTSSGIQEDFALMEKLLRSARWFRVLDRQRKETRLLKLESYYSQQKSITFAEFDGANPLQIQAAQFLDDLRQGRSAPSRADAESGALLKSLREATPPEPAAQHAT
jgi:hypothetical protein